MVIPSWSDITAEPVHEPNEINEPHESNTFKVISLDKRQLLASVKPLAQALMVNLNYTLVDVT